ncbi:uncharacterized protein [Zea mays]|uniref:uncharacterized protein isoform X9 n=1 Tax=Zea mays TaxID=4577 RepID=UPI0009AA8045|nr:uncharacterized protein LOC100382526 isoform X9 [Zea mays]|eukprot:XP_020400748.1 uncharacterized protein LOC100382526 isoform X12 [Zea mays]
MRTNTFDPKSFHCCGSVYFCFFVEICGPEPPILTCFLDEETLTKVIHLQDLLQKADAIRTTMHNQIMVVESLLSKVINELEHRIASQSELVKETMDTNGCNSVLRMESPCNTNDSKSLSRVDPPQVELTSCSDLEKVTRETSRYEPTTPTSNREMPPAAFHQRRELLSYEQLCCLDDVNFANAVIFGNKSCYCYQTLNLVLVTVFNLKIQKYSSITWNHSFSWVPNASNASCLIKLILQ